MRKAGAGQAPKARSRNLVIKKLAEEVLVYDLETDKAHCLNPSAALVWSHCDGRKTVLEIATCLRAEAGEPFTGEVVWLALNQLKRLSLLEESLELPGEAPLISRRELARRLGIATALTLPFIASIKAPAAIQAATCGAVGVACTNNARCCSGLCINNRCACLDVQSPCANDAQCCSNRCASANSKCLP